MKNRLDLFFIMARAMFSNAIALTLPALYLKLTHQTGRGSDHETPATIAAYFSECLEDYARQLGHDIKGFASFIKNKQILEYGPGDILGVAFLLYAYGARSVTCLDRFPMASPRKGELAIRQLLDSLPGEAKERALASLVTPDDPGAGFKANCIEYHVSPKGLSGETHRYDLIISRAVLEHVNDLHATFVDMKQALKPGGICIHQVDLRSHGLHRNHPLDFLSWSPKVWDFMHSGKGVPNRWRLDAYRHAAERAGFQIRRIEPIQHLSQDMVATIRPHLAERFKYVSDNDLACLTFWLVLEG